MKKILFIVICLISCITLTSCTVYNSQYKKFEFDKIIQQIENVEDVEEEIEEDTENDIEEVIPIKEYRKIIISSKNTNYIYASPKTSATILGSINSGDGLAYSSYSNGWYTTTYKSMVAYVPEKYFYIHQFEKSNYQVENVLEVGYQLLGFPYVWGAQRLLWSNGAKNTAFVYGKFDCSSLMQYIFYIGASVKLDVNTRTQFGKGKVVANGDLSRGDLMFFTNAERYYNTGLERVGHIAVYLGDNYILHTATDYAVIEQISSQRWKYFIQAERYL